jgi:drug/metabolite transporter (DMT)-like permease
VAAVAACLGATFCYGFVAAYTRRRLTGCAPMAVAAGSQISAALVLAVPALLNLPTTAPNLRAWLSALALAFACTGIAYILYFRLIAHIGAARATTVTFLIPLFAVLWGVTLLSEPVTPAMLVAGALILMGTALSTGLVSTTTFKRVGG